MNPDIDILLARYFSGEATVSDLSQLDEWLAASDGNEKYFEQLTSLYEKAAPAGDFRKPNGIKAVGLFRQYIHSGEAALSSGTSMQAEPANIEDVRHNPVPTRRSHLYWPAAAVVVLAITLSIFHLWKKKETPLQFASSANMELIMLPDSTMVRLSPYSHITCNKYYAKEERTINLVGCATFDVGQHGHGQFTVTAGDAVIRDIGTVFTVDAYEQNSELCVIVETGEVAITGIADTEVHVVANKAAIINKATKEIQIVGQGIDAPAQDAVDTSSPLVFDATPLYEVVHRLTQRYGVTVKLENASLAQRTISVRFHGEDVRVILDVIAETLALKLSDENGVYVLSEP